MRTQKNDFFRLDKEQSDYPSKSSQELTILGCLLTYNACYSY